MRRDAEHFRRLPPLQGSPKQISWAETIRAGIIAEAERYATALTKVPPSGEWEETCYRLYPIWLAGLREQASARWWIDHRYQGREEMLAGTDAAAALHLVFGGARPRTTAISLWALWLSRRPEALAYQAKERADEARRKADIDAHVAAVMAPVAKITPDMVPPASGDAGELTVTIDGHTVTLAPRLYSDGYHYALSQIDGRAEISFRGEFITWTYDHPEADALFRRLK
jgi:hypothetical protein